MRACLATQNCLLCIWLNAWPKVLSGLAWTRLRSLTARFRGGFLDPIVPFVLIAGLVAALLVGLSTVLAGCGGSAYFSLGHQSKIRNCFLDGGVANLGGELSDARRELQKYPGDEIPVTDAVSIVARVTGLRVHLLRDDEISEALEYASQLIASEKVRHGPYNIKNEIVKASKETWTHLTPLARS